MDYLWIIIVFPTIFLTIFGYVIYISFKRFKLLKEEFIVQSEKRGGTFNKKIFGTQSFTFPYKDSKIYVLFTPGGRYTPPHTTVSVNLKFFNKQELSVFPESFKSKISKKLTGQDIEIGDNNFDNEFIIKSTSSDFARSVLRIKTRDKLISLKNYKPHLFIENYEIKLDIPCVLKEKYEYDDIINIVLELYDEIKSNENKFKDSTGLASIESEKYYSEKRKKIRNLKIFCIFIILMVLSVVFFVSYIDYEIFESANPWDKDAISVDKVFENPDKYINTTQKVMGTYWPDWEITNDNMFMGLTSLNSLKVRFTINLDTNSLIKGDSYYFTGYLYEEVNDSYIYLLVYNIKPIDWLNE